MTANNWEQWSKECRRYLLLQKDPFTQQQPILNTHEKNELQAAINIKSRTLSGKSLKQMQSKGNFMERVLPEALIFLMLNSSLLKFLTLRYKETEQRIYGKLIISQFSKGDGWQPVCLQHSVLHLAYLFGLRTPPWLTCSGLNSAVSQCHEPLGAALNCGATAPITGLSLNKYKKFFGRHLSKPKVYF